MPGLPDAEAIVRGSRSALARALTAVENGAPGADALLAALAPVVGRAHVVGITGAPGAGKSTLINALLGELLACGKRVAVVAVDPSSPVSGGALLGDRVRMGAHGTDDRVFIRSLSSRGHLGGLSRATSQVVDLFDAAGFDVVVVETVGVGQSEVEIAQVADTRIVVCAPGLGDDVQAIKAGVLEIADIFVVNKADSPLAATTLRDLGARGGARKGGWQVPVLPTVATSGEGVKTLAEHIDAHARIAGIGQRLKTVSAQPKRAVLCTPATDETPLARLPSGAPRMIIVGAGRITQVLAPMAAIAGFDVVVIDPRREVVMPEGLPGVAVLTEWPDRALERLAPDAHSAIVMLADDDQQLDDAALAAAFASPAFYIGLSGCPRTPAERSAWLHEARPGDAIARIRTPAGLDLGGSEPAEIAVGILAEVIQARRRG